MSRDQAVLSRQQLVALLGQAERQTQLMEAMVSLAGAASPAPSFTGLLQTFLEMFEATAAACMGHAAASPAIRGPANCGARPAHPLPRTVRGDQAGGPRPTGALGGGPSLQVPEEQTGARRSAICVHAAIEGRGDQVAATWGDRRRGENTRKYRPGAVRGGAPSCHLGLGALPLPDGPSRGHHRRTTWPSSPWAGHMRAGRRLQEVPRRHPTEDPRRVPRTTLPLDPPLAPALPTLIIGPPLSPALILLLLSSLPRVQPLRARLLTHRGLLRRQGRSAGGVDNSDTSEVSAHSWRWAK